jgi:cysteine synthase A
LLSITLIDYPGEEGILAGNSSGAALAAAMRYARLESYVGKTILVILPDSGGVI